MDTSTTEVVGQIAGDMVRNGRYHPLFPKEIFGIPGFFLWNLLIILILALIFHWLLRGCRKTHETPMDLLKKRYVSGEIDKGTYEEMKEGISD